MTTRSTRQAYKLTSAEVEVVEAWKEYDDRSRRDDAEYIGGQLLARRGKLYYNPDPKDPEKRVCIGRIVYRGGQTLKEAYVGHTLAPQELQYAVAVYANAVDSTPRDHQ